MADRERWLTSAEAARRLGVQPATLYAYVSRGLIDRERAVDGRTSRFRHSDIEAMAAGRSRPGSRKATTGFAVVTTELTHLDDHSLTYRGHDVAELARTCSFEEVAELLWGTDGAGSTRVGGGRGPTWTAPPFLRDVAMATAALPPDAHPPDVLRVGVAAAAAVDDGRFALDRTSVAATARRLITTAVLSLQLRRRGPSTGSIAAMLWPRLTSRAPEPADLRTLDSALVLLADHELATSTVAVRVAASTRADPCSCVLSGLGVMSGYLHGGASAQVHRLLADARRPEEIRPAFRDLLRAGERLPGFGHQVYRVADPRLAPLREAMAASDLLSAGVEMIDAAIESAGISAPPNVDLCIGALSWAAEMRTDAGAVIFAVARMAGWVAHVIEEYDEAPLRFRARAVYAGAGQ